MARVDYDRQAEVYDRGRSMPPGAIDTWMVAARRQIGEDVERILDLGAGTCRFSVPLAEAFATDVVALEPSAGMRERATSRELPGVHVVGGVAEAIPLADDSCEAAWLSNSMHHFDDVELAAKELRRVIPTGGAILVRGTFAGRSYDLPILEFFPETAEILEDWYPTIDEAVALFEKAGFTSFHLEKVPFVFAEDHAAALEKTRYRADSWLETIDDDAFERGLERLAVAAQEREGPMSADLDLLVLR